MEVYGNKALFGDVAGKLEDTESVPSTPCTYPPPVH